MKGILKVRNFDSIKKLSLKRAAGKQKELYHRMSKIRISILFLEEHNMLTEDQLFDILLIYMNYQIECAKLSFRIYYAKDVRNVREFDEQSMLQYVRKVSVNAHRMTSNLPFEIYYKYRDVIARRERELELKQI